MTSLGCNVATCMYNEDRMCCKSEIGVTGSKADCADSTSCGSFDYSCSCKNLASGPNESLAVHCEAANCVYNEGHVCSADKISIQGASAHTADQTICASFICR